MTLRALAIIVTLAGLGCLVAGAWLFHVAAGLSVLGVALIGTGLLAIPTGGNE